LLFVDGARWQSDVHMGTEASCSQTCQYVQYTGTNINKLIFALSLPQSDVSEMTYRFCVE